MGITYKDEVKTVLGVIWAEKNSKIKKFWKISILSIDLSIFMAFLEHFWPQLIFKLFFFLNKASMGFWSDFKQFISYKKFSKVVNLLIFKLLKIAPLQRARSADFPGFALA